MMCGFGKVKPNWARQTSEEEALCAWMICPAQQIEKPLASIWKPLSRLCACKESKCWTQCRNGASYLTMSYSVKQVIDMRRDRDTVTAESDSLKEETERMNTRSKRLTLDKSNVVGCCARAAKHKQNITQSVCVGGCIHVGISYNMTDMLEQGLQQTKVMRRLPHHSPV